MKTIIETCDIEIQASATVCDIAIALSSAVKIEAASETGKPRGFEMVAYNGGPMQLRGWQYPVVVDLKGMSGMDKSRPAFHNHNPEERVGHTTEITCGANHTPPLTAKGMMSGASALAKEICAEGDNGFPWQASIGAKVIAREFVPEGMQAVANGKTFDGPIYVARKTVLGEISFVSLGADDSTSARIAATKAEGDSIMEFDAWLKASGFDIATLTEGQYKRLSAAYKAEHAEGTVPAWKAPEVKAAAGTDDLLIKARQELAGESKRVAAIRKLCASGPKMEIEEGGKKSAVEIEAHAIEQGWDAARTELEVLRAARTGKTQETSGFMINTGAGLEASSEILAAAGAMSCGVSEKTACKGLDERSANIVASRPMRGMGLHRIMAMIAAASGVYITAGGMTEDNIRKVLELDVRASATGAFSTMSLSGITQNILNKALLASWDTQESVVSDIAYETDTNDFKQYNRYILTGSGTMPVVGPAGDLKALSLQDETYSNQLTTNGCIIAVTRQILINDDMGALSQMPQIVAQQAALARERAVITAVGSGTSTVAPGASPGQAANGFNFISTGAKNYITGATSSMSTTSLTIMEQQFLEQTNANGDPIMVMPDRVLLPPALKTTALNLFNGANLVVTALGSTSASAVAPDVNRFKGMYRPVVSPYLSTVFGITGSSQTAFYLLPNPSGGRAMVSVGYLRGQRTPTIERGEVSFNTLGISLRGFYDFGVALLDYRCVQASKGAA